MFVRWLCGCIGIPGATGRAAVVVLPCDDDGRDRADESLGWATRSMDPMSSVPLSEEAEDLLFKKIRIRFHKADRYDDLKAALRD